MFRASACAAAVVSILLTAAAPAVAHGSTPKLLRVSPGGQTVAVRDRLPADLPAPRPVPVAVGARSSAVNGSVTKTIERMVTKGWITRSRGDSALKTWRAAVEVRKRTKGRAGLAIGSAIDLLVGMADRGSLTPSRLPMAILTAKRNADFFASGKVPAAYTRVQFNEAAQGAASTAADRSDLVWQYYPGQGLQLQVLASFGVANGLWRASRTKPSLKANLRRLLDELSALAAGRAGGVAWEYSFAFDGGKPPWASGMTQATAVQALSRGSTMLGEPRYARLAARALPLFDSAPPSGVRLNTAKGPWYLMYTFDRSQLVLNGFLQSLVGLDEMRDLTGSRTADRLFRQADPVAQTALPRYRSTGWSYYSPGEWDTVDYHSLTTGFLEELCRRTKATAYCTTGSAFRAFLNTAPSLSVKTRSLRVGRKGTISFWVSKPATVRLSVATAPGNRAIHSARAQVNPGVHRWDFTPPTTARTMTVTVTASDSLGHARTVTSALTGTKR